MGLDELLQSLRRACAAAQGSERGLIEADLAWCHVEQGALGEAFGVLWDHETTADSEILRRLTRAELQAYCGNEDAALALLDGLPEGAGVSMTRARVAAGRGDWEQVVRLVPAGSGSESSKHRALRLAARASLELGRFEKAAELLMSVERQSPIEALAVAALRAHLRDGDPAPVLRRVADEARAHGAARIEAETWADLALLHRSREQPDEMQQAAVRAVELWDDMVTSLPPPLRAGFWSDVRRDTVRGASRKPKHTAGAQTSDRLAPLLSNLRRLASEREPSKLLSVITDGAVALTGAERGFVLLVDENGSLEATTIRGAERELGTQAAAFSRSIAEVVLIDGDPVVTVDASHDTRVQDYMSVHRLMLKSVACLPIASRGRTWGVLYLEHRSASGRFSGVDLTLLRAYADQAAIAIETSELFAQVEAQKHDLEQANRALREANAELEQRLDGQAAVLENTRRQIERLQGSSAQGQRWGLVGTSEGMRRVYEMLDRVSATDVPVAITGQSGTGKELVARAIHRGSARAEGPYVSLSCGAIPDGLLESELFGHEAGAFTGAARARDGVFAQAHGGTLLMDEIADMPPRMQLDLLRVLQEGRVRPVGAAEERAVDVRLLTASRQSLRALVEQGKLREDLYYRLAVVEIALPPLGQRRSDIPLLCDHFLQRIATERGEPKKRLSPAALRRLYAHAFPGNIRELEHLLINATVFVTGQVIDAKDLAIETVEDRPERDDEVESYRDFKDAERDRIVAALNANDWNRARAARALGMARRTFYRRLAEHGIELPKTSR